jgi:hypothetical protein
MSRSQSQRPVRLADLVIRAGRIYTMASDRAVGTSMAVRDGRIIAVSRDADGLDELITDGTQVVDDRELTLYPAFIDTHNHQLWAARDLEYVALEDALTIADVVAKLRKRAEITPKGEWVISSRCWHETHVEESRLPRATELDEASTRHPILVQRGGHVAVANSVALRMAGITADSPDPERGTVVRDADGVPTGVLIEGPAIEPVRRLLPPVTFEQDVAHLEHQCRIYNSCGIGIVRDPGLFRHEMLVYQNLWEQGRLTTRTRVLFFVRPTGDLSERLNEIDSFPVRSGFGDDRLQIWGLKLGIDGGVEGAALCEPYANNPDFRGHAFFEVDELTAIVEHAVSRGWRVGCHAVGDRAVIMLLDAYEKVVANHPALPRGTLVIEHAFLADTQQRARAVALGVAVTVQHPLLYSLGGNLLRYWGEDRTREVMPVSAWLEDGAMVAAGSDCNVSFFDPLLSMWGMVTRGTRVAGIQGPEYAVDQYTAVELYTAAGARLLNESDRIGTLQPGRYGDVVAFRTDLVTCSIDDLPEASPVFTLVGGEPVFDPQNMITPAKG